MWEDAGVGGQIGFGLRFEPISSGGVSMGTRDEIINVNSVNGVVNNRGGWR